MVGRWMGKLKLMLSQQNIAGLGVGAELCNIKDREAAAAVSE